MRDDPMEAAHAALERMKRASHRGTGCHLTREMIEGLGLTFLAETWSEDRASPTRRDGE